MTQQPESPLNWVLIDDEDDKLHEHVVPSQDIYVHASKDCWCKPFNDGFIVIHNSADQREYYFEHKTRKVN